MSNGLSVGVLLAVVALLGIPHGAVDHLVVTAITAQHGGRPRPVRFQVHYVAVVAASGTVWLVSAPLALATFLLLSVHHFGQSDLAHLGRERAAQFTVQWSRGVLVIGLPLVGHLSVVSPLIARLGGGEPARWSWLAGHTTAWCVALIAQHAVIGWWVVRGINDAPLVRREAASCAALVVLFVLAGPLLGFAVYFGFWHSLRHLRVLVRVLGERPESLPVGQFIRLAAPRTGLALLGLVLATVVTHLVGRPDLAVPAVFVMFSMLTLPHLLVVERLWQHLRRADHDVVDQQRRLIPSDCG